MPDIRKSFHQELDEIQHDLVRLAGMVTEAIPQAPRRCSPATSRQRRSSSRATTCSTRWPSTSRSAATNSSPSSSRWPATCAASSPPSACLRDRALRRPHGQRRQGARRIYGGTPSPRSCGPHHADGRRGARLVKLAIDAYVEHDDSLAAALDDMDDRLDELHKDYIQAIFETHGRRARDPGRGAARAHRPLLRAHRRPRREHRRAGAVHGHRLAARAHRRRPRGGSSPTVTSGRGTARRRPRRRTECAPRHQRRRHRGAWLLPAGRHGRRRPRGRRGGSHGDRSGSGAAIGNFQPEGDIREVPSSCRTCPAPRSGSTGRRRSRMAGRLGGFGPRSSCPASTRATTPAGHAPLGHGRRRPHRGELRVLGVAVSIGWADDALGDGRPRCAVPPSSGGRPAAEDGAEPQRAGPAARRVAGRWAELAPFGTVRSTSASRSRAGSRSSSRPATCCRPTRHRAGRGGFAAVTCSSASGASPSRWPRRRAGSPPRRGAAPTPIGRMASPSAAGPGWSWPSPSWCSPCAAGCWTGRPATRASRPRLGRRAWPVEGRARLGEALDAIPLGVIIGRPHGRGRLPQPRGGPVPRRPPRRGAGRGGRSTSCIADALEGGGRRRSLDLFGPPAGRSCSPACRSTTSGPVGGRRGDRGRVRAPPPRGVRPDFVANISHELKTAGRRLGLLAETMPTRTIPSVTQRLAERMLAEAFRVGRTIDDLLELSRIEADEPTPAEPVPSTSWPRPVERIRPAASTAARRSRWPRARSRPRCSATAASSSRRCSQPARQRR